MGKCYTVFDASGGKARTLTRFPPQTQTASQALLFLGTSLSHMVPAHLVQRLKEEQTAAQAEVVALKARLAIIEATAPPASDESGIARHTSEEDASGEALGGSEDLLPSAALCALLELHPGKQHQPMAGRDLLALLLDAGHLQLAVARRGARARWQAALKPAIALGAAVTDPWLEYNVHKQPTELAVRCDYDLTPSPNADPDPDPSPSPSPSPNPNPNPDPDLHPGPHPNPNPNQVRWDYDPATGAWVSSETLIKMERTPFAKGAMRECLRMKKMSQVSSYYGR